LIQPRPVTAACNDVEKDNPLFLSGALDLIGFNYHNYALPDFLKNFPHKKIYSNRNYIGPGNTRALRYAFRQYSYLAVAWDKPFHEGNPDNTVSAYDNVQAPWGSTHEETWKIIKNIISCRGLFVWTGFDYLGEPTPYGWPSRSSYFGTVDLAGFPKNVYYMYQSEWTKKPMLHIFPHWNWKEGQTLTCGLTRTLKK